MEYIYFPKEFLEKFYFFMVFMFSNHRYKSTHLVLNYCDRNSQHIVTKSYC